MPIEFQINQNKNGIKIRRISWEFIANANNEISFHFIYDIIKYNVLFRKIIK